MYYSLRIVAASFLMVVGVSATALPLDCLRAPLNGVEIDGDLAEWSGADAITFNESGDSVEVRVLWDDEALYVAFLVSDDSLWSDAKPNPWETWRNDSVEIYFDAANDDGAAPRTDDHQFHVDFSHLTLGLSLGQTNGGEVGTGTNWAGWGPAAARWQAGLDGTGNVGTSGDTGYTYEIALDWDSIGRGAAPGGPSGTRGGLRPAVGSAAGIAFAVVDDDDGGERERVSTPSGVDPQRPESYLDLTFRGDSSTPADGPLLPSLHTIDDPEDGASFFPRLLGLPSGEVLCAFDTNAGGGPTRIAVARRPAGSCLWQPLATVASTPNTLANGFLVLLDDGSILCAYREVASEEYWIRVSRSTDGGATWQLRGTVHQNGRGLWEPWILVLPGGRVLCAYATEEYAVSPDQAIEIRSSDDGGQSWIDPVIAVKLPGSRDGVPALARLHDGSLLCFFEATDLANPFAIRVSTSTDGGQTWSGRRLVYAPANPAKRAAAPTATLLSDGRIWCGFYTDERRAEHGDPFADALWLESSDDGLTWSDPFTLHATSGADFWGHFIELRDSTILAAFYTNSNGNPRLLARGCEEKPALEVDCANGVDDDGDGDLDCSDADCVGTEACVENCDNDSDDDLDGAIDCFDTDCVGTVPCVESCDNGLDDDADGDVDCFDTDCVEAPLCVEDCSNGVDDDVDGEINCSDADCVGTVACVEDCSNSTDDDLDGDVDCFDADCVGAASCVEDCSNGVDDDVDGEIDCSDADCAGALDCGGRQLSGDCNQDGALDISDGICLLGHLFANKPERLPCDDGRPTDPGNVLLMDVNGDAEIDLSDGIRLFSFLFTDAAAPVLGTQCVMMIGCPTVCEAAEGK